LTAWYSRSGFKLMLHLPVTVWINTACKLMQHQSLLMFNKNKNLLILTMACTVFRLLYCSGLITFASDITYW